MSLLALRLGIQTNEQQSTTMYSVEGAKFQEWAMQFLTPTNKQGNPIGSLVTEINNREITVEAATRQFNNWLWAGYSN